MPDIEQKHFNLIKSILAEYVSDCQVRAFGSRVNGTARQHSDLDLAIVGKTKMPLRTKTLLKEAFENSDLPFRVDIIDYNAISDSFRKIIDSKYEIIQNHGTDKST